MFRPRRPLRARPGPAVPPAVAEAERLMHSGQFAAAAQRFEAQAQEAERRARPEAAGHLHLRAARSYVEINDLDRADSHAERAIQLFIEAGRPGLVHRLLPRVLSGMERHGRQADAERLRAQVEQAFGAAGLPRRGTGRLPARCPNCGGPLRPDEVDWAAADTAECPFCSGIVKTE